MRKSTPKPIASQARLSNAAKFAMALRIERDARDEAKLLFQSGGVISATYPLNIDRSASEKAIQQAIAAEVFVLDKLRAHGFCSSGRAGVAASRISAVAAATGVMPEDPSDLLKPSYANALRSAQRLCGSAFGGAALREGPSRANYVPEQRAPAPPGLPSEAEVAKEVANLYSDRMNRLFEDLDRAFPPNLGQASLSDLGAEFRRRAAAVLNGQLRSGASRGGRDRG